MAQYSDRDRIVTVGRLYFVDGLSQPQIARRLGMGQATVSRLIKEARRSVRIDIYAEDEEDNLAAELVSRFSPPLERAIVVYTGEPGHESKRLLGRAAAIYFKKELIDHRTSDPYRLAIACGETLKQMVLAVQPEEVAASRQALRRAKVGSHGDLPPLEITVMGLEDVPDTLHQAPAVLAGMLAAKFSTARAYGVQPFSLEGSKEDRKALRDIYERHSAWKEIQTRLGTAQAAFFGVGPMRLSPEAKRSDFFARLFMGCFDDDRLALRAIEAAGAVGEINNIPYDIDGCPCIIEQFEERMPRVFTLETLRASKAKKVAIAGGRDKATAVRAALRGEFISVLITDTTCARGILEQVRPIS